MSGDNRYGWEEEALKQATEAEQKGFDDAYKKLSEYSGLSIDTAKQYIDAAINDAKSGNNESIDYIKKLYPQINDTLQNAITAVQSASTTAQGTLGQGMQQGAQALASTAIPAMQSYSPYAQAGNEALNKYMGIQSGTMPITQDPVYERNMQLMNQSLAAQGYTGSGTAVMNAASPIIADLYQRQLNALQPIINTGLSATGSQAQMGTNLGSNLANLYTGGSTNIANLQNTAGQNTGNIYGNLANYQSALGTNAANLYNTGGQYLSGLYNTAGSNLANLYGDTGTALASTQLGQALNQGAGYKNIAALRAGQQPSNLMNDVVNPLNQISQAYQGAKQAGGDILKLMGGGI
jgi:hypothetical protein